MPIKSKTAGPCPLCSGKNTGAYTADRTRQYDICRNCTLVFVPQRFQVSEAREKERYDSHNNHPDDPGYRKFLSRLLNPLCGKLPEGAAGLDFGCGPGPALAAMFEECGNRMDVYDKFYAKNTDVFNKTYDFITATEVVEHLNQPGDTLARLYGMLKNGGILGIMTKLVRSREAFKKWHYKRDDTHICFFSKPAFVWLGNVWQARVEFVDDDVILIHKKAARK